MIPKMILFRNSRANRYILMRLNAVMIQGSEDIALNLNNFRDTYFAIHSNSPNEVIDVITRLTTKGNCKSRVDRSKYIVRLYAIKNISAYVE